MKSFIAFWAFVFKFLITIPLIAYLVYLTIANRAVDFEMSWSPLQGSAVLSLPVIIFAAVIAGFIWGSLILWSNTLQIKEEARVNRKRIANLEAQLDLQRVEYEKLRGRLQAAEHEGAHATAARISGPEIL